MLTITKRSGIRATLFAALLTTFFYSRSLAQESTDQIGAWSKLDPLSSTREEVESLLGKAEQSFPEYAIYRTSVGRFHVWYAKGGCHNGGEGMIWNVPRGKMTHLLVYVNKSLPLTSYVSNIKDLKRQESPLGYSRIQYFSTDESFVYVTIQPKHASEFVYSIELLPSDKEQGLLCTSK